MVFVWNLRVLSKNSILCGESSSTYQSFKIVTFFFPSSFLISLFPFYFSQFQRVPNRFPSLLMPKIGSANQGSINWYQIFGSWNQVLFILCVFFLLCVSSFVCSFPFCLTLYYYFIFLYFISLNISFFFELYLVSISFLSSYIYIYIYIYSIKICAKKRKERNPIFKFGVKSLLQFKFGFVQSHICIQIWILCKKKCIDKKRKQKKAKKKKHKRKKFCI